MLGTVAYILNDRESKGWLVGGNVRDARLGRHAPDLDIVVADDPAAVARAVAASLGASWFVLSERHPAYRVVSATGHIDVAEVRGGDILADLALRDFTINAMAVPVLAGTGEVPDRATSGGGDEGSVVDPFGGLTHLRERRLVAVSDGIFADDPLRLMRAARFCHVLGFKLDDALAEMVRQEAPRLVNAAAERVVSEMALTLGVGRSAEAVELWHGLHLLVAALPELSTVDEIAPILGVLEAVDDLLARPAVWFPHADRLLGDRLAGAVDGSVSRATALRLAALTAGLAPGAARSAAQRLKLSREMGSLLWTVSRNLSRGDGLPPVDARERDVVLALWESAPWEPETIVLAAAQAQAAAAGADTQARGVPDPTVLGPARRLMDLWAARAVRGVPRPPVDGSVLMRELGLSSGPPLGKALREVRLAWESGEIATRDAALATARDALGLR